MTDVAVVLLPLSTSTFILLHIPADRSTTVHVTQPKDLVRILNWQMTLNAPLNTETITMHPNVHNVATKTANAYRDGVHFQILGLLRLLFYSRH